MIFIFFKTYYFYRRYEIFNKNLKEKSTKKHKKESLLSKIKKKIKKGIENIVFSNNLKHYLSRYQQIQAIPQ